MQPPCSYLYMVLNLTPSVLHLKVEIAKFLHELLKEHVNDISAHFIDIALRFYLTHVVVRVLQTLVLVRACYNTYTLIHSTTVYML